MNSSASTSFAPDTDSANEMCLGLALTDDTVEETAEVLSADEVAIIVSFLSDADIMRARVCTTWRDAAKKTIVPPSDFVVDSVRSYNAMRVMATALPNIQQLSISDLCHGHKYIDGEDPDEEIAAETAHETTHDINIISNFTKLRVLEIDNAPLNGRYPSLYNFPNLQSLAIAGNYNLKLDLDMLMFASLPLLKQLTICVNTHLTGNLRSLRVLKDTLEEVEITDSRKIEGNLMDLADFPRLKELDLRGTSVTGDIRDIDIGEYDFPALESFALPYTVRGGMGYQFQNISDVPDFMHTIYLLLQRTPAIFEKGKLLSKAYYWKLSEVSPDWYDRQIGRPRTPFGLKFLRAGSRLGWCWCIYIGPWGPREELHSCEINWLDPEPSSESDDYRAYIEALQRIEGELNIDFYRGYHEPPTEMEYRRLCEGLEQRD
eukprot:scaffold11824_cov78-Skeletonema_dohrnii-CCMP3373.AAC.1